MSRYRFIPLLFLCASALFAQGTDLGSIRGVVTDATGSTVPGAAVTITDVGTNATVKAQTDSAGEYEANALCTCVTASSQEHADAAASPTGANRSHHGSPRRCPNNRAFVRR